MSNKIDNPIIFTLIKELKELDKYEINASLQQNNATLDVSKSRLGDWVRIEDIEKIITNLN